MVRNDRRELKRSPTAARRRMVLASACTAALISLGGLAGAAFVKSPSEAAADARAPKPNVITAAVQQEVLRNTLMLRGKFSDGRTVSAQPTSVAMTDGVPNANSSGGVALVVTGVFARAGQSVRAGQPLLEYSGRPVFALPGDVPMYRDLMPGESGKDVAQLQRALISLGFDTAPDTTGSFGGGTERAVRRLYRQMGYTVPVIAAQSQTAPATATPAAGTPSRASTAPAQAQPELLPIVPASELLFVPSMPARVVSVPVAVGDQVKGPVITLARGGPILTGMLDPSQATLIKPSLAAQITDDTTGQEVAGTVTGIGSIQTATAGSDQSGGLTAFLPVSIKPVAATWPDTFADEDVQITITTAATPKPVLAVPEAAIFARADGHTSVTVLDANGAQHTIAVSAGASADGMVQVTPMSGALRAGDNVVVGR